MSIWMVFSLICVIYFETETIDRIGQQVWGRLKFEWNYFWIRRSIRLMEKDWR